MNLDNYKDRSKFIKRLIFWSIVIGGLLALAFAQTSVTSFAQPIPVCEAFGGGCVEGVEDVDTGREAIVDTIIGLVRWAIYVSVGVTVLMIVIGAYYMITSAGNDERYSSGLKTVRNAVIGMVLAILSLTIVNLISTLVSGL